MSGLQQSASDIEIWSIDLGSRDFLTLERFEWLDDDEIARYDRFLNREEARRFATAHICLRAILAAHSSNHPKALHFARTKWGRPFLHEGPNFSLSHSGDGALVAVSGAAFLGVDLEHRSDLPMDVPPKDICTSAELKRLRLMRLDSDILLRLWVCKEAAAKALGLGLHHPFSDIAIPIMAAGRQARQRIIVRVDGRLVVWHLSDLDVGTNFVASLVTDRPMGSAPEVRLFSIAHMGRS